MCFVSSISAPLISWMWLGRCFIIKASFFQGALGATDVVKDQLTDDASAILTDFDDPVKSFGSLAQVYEIMSCFVIEIITLDFLRF